MAIPLLIIVTGLPCTGKTTIARKLAAELGLLLLSKDDIKERLFDSLGWSDREWSKKLSLATMALLFYLIELELQAGHSLIAEAPFYPTDHAESLNRMRQKATFQPLVIECAADGKLLLQRFIRRSEAGERHPGFVDSLCYGEVETLFSLPKPEPLPIDGTRIELDTNDFNKVDLNGLVSRVRSELEKASKIE